MRHTVVSLFPDLVADKYVGRLPMSVQTGTNADIVYELRDVYFGNDRSIVDLTYGDHGGWWKRHRPDGLTVSTHDFTALPYADGAFDTVCYDPPYIPQGGTGSVSLDEFRGRFGLYQRNEYDLLTMIVVGASEAARVTNRTTGFLCIKAMDFVNGGAFCDWTYRVHRHLIDSGMALHDEVIHNGGTGPGGHNISKPKRSRRSHSKLLVFTWGRR